MIKQYVPENIARKIESASGPDVSVDDIKYIKSGTICVDAADYSGVVYDEKGNLCEASVTHRFDGHMAIPRCTPPCTRVACNIDCIDDVVVFAGGGYIFSHFGHFLLEGLSRLYPALDKSYRDKKFVFIVSRKTKQLPGYVMTILSGLGIKPENIILINKTTRFAGVYVPPQSSIITKYISPIMIETFNKISKNLGNAKIKTYDKIYLSRSKMHDDRTFGEERIEHIFAKNGYKIIWPETLPLTEQITLARNCRVMAGTAGTALHLALFMKPHGTVIQIKRNKLAADSAEIQNDICTAKKLNFTYIAGSVEDIPTVHFTNTPQIIGVTEHLKQFFDDNKFRYTKNDIAFDCDAHAKYVVALHRYNRKQKRTKVINFIARIVSVFGITKYNRQCLREGVINLFR